MKKRRSDAQSPMRRRLAIAALGIFLLGDVVLISTALNSTRSISAPSGYTPPAASSSPDPGASPDPEPTPSIVAAVRPMRIVVALDADTVWRATTGACPATVAAPELTTDSGATWTATDTTGPTGVVALSRIIVNNESDVTMIGQDVESCAPALARTFVGGDDYAAYPDRLVAEWFVQPADAAIVHSPAGDIAAPCTNVLVIAADDEDSAAVLCSDQSVWITNDSGATWPDKVAVLGGMNLAASEQGYRAAVLGAPGCVGVQVVTIVQSAPPVASGCFPTVSDPASLAGAVALTEADGNVWLWAGEAFVRSADGGVTWQ